MLRAHKFMARYIVPKEYRVKLVFDVSTLCPVAGRPGRRTRTSASDGHCAHQNEKRSLIMYRSIHPAPHRTARHRLCGARGSDVD